MVQLIAGWRMDRKRYNGPGLMLFYGSIEDVRKEFKPTTGVLFGVRFKSNEDILARIESGVPEKVFVIDPYRDITIAKALCDAAKADFWYENEKDYGTDD